MKGRDSDQGEFNSIRFLDLPTKPPKFNYKSKVNKKKSDYPFNSIFWKKNAEFWYKNIDKTTDGTEEKTKKRCLHILKYSMKSFGAATIFNLIVLIVTPTGIGLLILVAFPTSIVYFGFTYISIEKGYYHIDEHYQDYSDDVPPPNDLDTYSLKTVESNKPVEIKKLESAHSCGICLGVIKPNLKSVICSCNKLYHISCAIRIGECPKCDEKFNLENFAKLKLDEMEELEELDESSLLPEEFEEKKDIDEKVRYEIFAEIISKLEDRLADGEISEKTYLVLKEKYEKEAK